MKKTYFCIRVLKHTIYFLFNTNVYILFSKNLVFRQLNNSHVIEVLQRKCGCTLVKKHNDCENITSPVSDAVVSMTLLVLLNVPNATKSCEASEWTPVHLKCFHIHSQYACF